MVGFGWKLLTELSERSLREIRDTEDDVANDSDDWLRSTCRVETRNTNTRSARRAKELRVFGTREIVVVVDVAAAMQSKNRNHPPVAHKRSISINQLQG